MAGIEGKECTMTYRSRWTRWIRFTRRTATAVPPRPRHHDTPVLEEDELPKGCGWFDSSHELMRGLVVMEQLQARA
jgi:hypothetical protein